MDSLIDALGPELDALVRARKRLDRNLEVLLRARLEDLRERYPCPFLRGVSVRAASDRTELYLSRNGGGIREGLRKLTRERLLKDQAPLLEELTFLRVQLAGIMAVANGHLCYQFLFDWESERKNPGI